jgi:uncharacterized protein YkuJ
MAGSRESDEIIDLNDRIIEKLFSTAKNTHQKQFQQSGKAITEVQSLKQPESFDYLDLMCSHYSTLRRYVPAFLEVLKIQSTPSSHTLEK